MRKEPGILLSTMFGFAFFAAFWLKTHHFPPLQPNTDSQKMSAPSTKLTTRSSNAAKHPGIPDQTKKKRSPAQMAALRASEKAAKDAKAAAALAAPGLIAGVEDSMATDDKDDEMNAAQPAPVKIIRVNRPIIRRTHTFSNVLDLERNVEEVQEGQLPVVIFCPFLNASPIKESSAETIEEFTGSDSSETADSDATSELEEPTANPEYFEEPKSKKGKAKAKAKKAKAKRGDAQIGRAHV